MTTETMTNETTRLEELLAKARATREARRQQQEAEKAAEQAEWQQPFGEAVARARAIVEPALGECATEEYDGSYRRLLVIPRVWKGLVTFYMETGNGGMWKLAGAKATCYLAGPDEWELSGPLAWLAAMDDLFQERRKTALECRTAIMDATRHETVARETHAQLLALDETRAEEWDALLAAAHDRIAARAAAMDAYVQALGEWRYKYEETLADDIEPTITDGEYEWHKVWAGPEPKPGLNLATIMEWRSSPLLVESNWREERGRPVACAMVEALADELAEYAEMLTVGRGHEQPG
jgi:hypothetical protein